MWNIVNIAYENSVALGAESFLVEQAAHLGHLKLRDIHDAEVGE